MENRFFVPRPKFDEMSGKIACLQIVEKKNCPTVRFDNKLFVIAAAAGTGTGRGWSYLEGYEVVPVDRYTGDLVPLDYSKHFQEVTEGNRERSYNGLKITADGISVVCLGPSKTFLPLESGQQIKLF
jgi:hypothetical protein